MVYNSDYEIRLAELEALGGDVTKHYDSVYEIDLAILEIVEGGIGTTYTAGEGISIDSANTISVDTDTIQEKLTAGDNITISGNTISATGGDAIEDVSVLPDASANKNKFVRLASDKKVYVSEAQTIQTGSHEENAPDSEQIGEAQIHYTSYGGGDVSFIYTGEQYILKLSDDSAQVTAYLWKRDDSQQLDMVSGEFFTSVPAEEINSGDELVFKLVGADDFTPTISGNVITLDATEWTLSFGALEQQTGQYWWKEELKDIVKVTVPEYETVYSWQPINQPLQSITYNELKSLRDNSQLVPGQQYRITDYVTTTAQASTQSAGHQFDIIVIADDVNKLNENARAIQHKNPAFKIYNDDEGLSRIYQRYPDGDDENGYAWVYNNSGDDSQFTDAWIDWTDIDTDIVLYTNTLTPAIGTEFELLLDDEPFTFTLTDFSEYAGYFMNSKLDAWELKYCLDNDTNRFSWAQVGQEGFAAMRLYNEDEGLDNIFKHYSEGDGENGYCWKMIADSGNKSITDISDWDDFEIGNDIYTETLDISVGDEIYYPIFQANVEVTEYSANVNYVPSGKGVIYYMKDEWNNQVYFDFKNIMIYDAEDIADYGYLFGKDDGDYSLKGTSNNNIIECQIVGDGIDTDAILTIDTSLLFYASVGYQNIVKLEPTIEGSATLVYDNSMNITGISGVTFNGYTESDLLNMNDAKVRISFEMSIGGSSNGTITQSGILSKFVMSMGGMDIPMLMITFGFMDMATQTFKTLYMVYDTSLQAPAWMVQL